jgi:TonB family protein
MRLAKVFVVNLFVFVMFAGLGNAQDVPKTINGGVLNGKAVSLPKPAYPAEARAGKLEGTVAIKITIDEEGNVIDAEPQEKSSSIRTIDANGEQVVTADTLPDASLVESALAAAREAKFAPTKLSGQPVKVTGVIVYNFVASSFATKGTGITGGVLNGKAIEMPLPTYPPAAKAVRAGGAVTVQVTIDENGEVISASAVSGHPLLRAAAMDAAKLARFSPTQLDGKGVKVTGVLVYNFVPPDASGN